MSLEDSRLLRISSKNRATSSKSKYEIIFNTNDNDLHQIKRIALKSAIFPNTQYNVNSNNNLFHLPNTLSGVSDFTIPVGQYTTTTLITALQTAVAGLTVVQDATTLKLTLSVVGPDTFDIISDKTLNPMGAILGLDTDDLAVSSHTAPSVIDLRGLTNI